MERCFPTTSRRVTSKSDIDGWIADTKGEVGGKAVEKDDRYVNYKGEFLDEEGEEDL